jgi:antitoxin (DNA-binding transcriptional repressor) of toxin-antitoxin stability system
MNYKVHQAKTNLSKLLDQVENGKEVTISRGNDFSVKLVPTKGAKKRVPGELRGQLRYTADAFAPLTDKELKELGFE